MPNGLFGINFACGVGGIMSAAIDGIEFAEAVALSMVKG
jgi:uncharacterized FAD-dependent dehydrogenase